MLALARGLERIEEMDLGILVRVERRGRRKRLRELVHAHLACAVDGQDPMVREDLAILVKIRDLLGREWADLAAFDFEEPFLGF
jgi:hypothetical protein